jgi:hypothetical protein
MDDVALRLSRGATPPCRLGSKDDAERSLAQDAPIADGGYPAQHRAAGRLRLMLHSHPLASLILAPLVINYLPDMRVRIQLVSPFTASQYHFEY